MLTTAINITHQSYHCTQYAGTEVSIQHEGGFAAAVVGLMATDSLVFRTRVPDQLVVLDPTLSLVDQQYVRILQRYKELLRSSGLVDTEVGRGRGSCYCFY